MAKSYVLPIVALGGAVLVLSALGPKKAGGEPIPNPLPPKFGDVDLHIDIGNNILITVENLTTKDISGKVFIDIFAIGPVVERVVSTIKSVSVGPLDTTSVDITPNLDPGTYNIIVSMTTNDDLDLQQTQQEFTV